MSGYRIQLRLSRPTDPFYPDLFITADEFDEQGTYSDFIASIDEALLSVYDTIRSDRDKSSDDVLASVMDGR